MKIRLNRRATPLTALSTPELAHPQTPPSPLPDPGPHLRGPGPGLRCQLAHGPQLRHGQTCPHFMHLPSTPAADSHSPGTTDAFVGVLRIAEEARPRDPLGGLPGGAGRQVSQRRMMELLAACTASSASTPPSQAEVDGHCPRHRSAAVPSDHSTPSAITAGVEACRMSWKSLGCLQGVFMPQA